MGVEGCRKEIEYYRECQKGSVMGMEGWQKEIE